MTSCNIGLFNVELAQFCSPQNISCTFLCRSLSFSCTPTKLIVPHHVSLCSSLRLWVSICWLKPFIPSPTITTISSAPSPGFYFLFYCWVIAHHLYSQCTFLNCHNSFEIYSIWFNDRYKINNYMKACQTILLANKQTA